MKLVPSNTSFKKYADNRQLNRHKDCSSTEQELHRGFLSETTTRKKASQQLMGIQFNNGTNSKGRPTSSRKSTTLHRPTPTTRVQEHPILKATTGSSSRYMTHTSEDYGKQQSTTFIPPATNLRCTRLPPTKN